QRVDGCGVSGEGRIADAGAGAARDCGRMLRYGGDCAGLPRFYYFLYCEYAAAGGDSRVATRRIWAAHGAVRSGVAGGVSGWARGAVVGESREGRGGVQEDFRAGCGTVCEGGRAVEEAGALVAAVV